MKYYAIIQVISLVIYPREMKLMFTQKFIAALSKIAKKWKPPKYPSTDK